MGDTPMVLRGHHDSEAATNMSPEGEIHPINPWPGDVVLARPDMGKNSESDPVTRGPDMGKKWLIMVHNMVKQMVDNG